MSFSSRLRRQRAHAYQEGASVCRPYSPACEIACRACNIAYGAVEVDGEPGVYSYESAEMMPTPLDGSARDDVFVPGRLLAAERNANRHYENLRQARGNHTMAQALDRIDAVNDGLRRGARERGE